MEFNNQFLVDTLPVLSLVAFGLLVMLLDAFKNEKLTSITTIAGILISMILAIPGLIIPQEMTLTFYNEVYAGGLAGLIHILLCLSGIISVPFISEYLKKQNQTHLQGEIFALIIFSLIGMSLLATANDLMMTFIGLEIMSVSLYILAGSFKRDLRSNEAALKYFLLGAFASAFLLLGISLLYGMTGTTLLDRIASISPNLIKDKFPVLFYPALTLIAVGFLFKLSAFPFHIWTPDVYTGSPTPLVGFMATGSKMASVIAFGFILSSVLPHSGDKLSQIIALLAVLSMIYGNIVAAQQKNIKRLLAYSSISHTGYMLLGVAGGPEGYKAAIFYMLIYTFMTIAAFALISSIENSEEDLNYENWKGYGLKNIPFGIMMSIMMFSLAGFPPLAGFIGKYFVFLAAVKGGYTAHAVVGILTSVIGAYYYLRVLVSMYFEKPTQEYEQKTLTINNSILIPIAILALIILIIGVLPAPISSYLDILYGKAGFLAKM